MSYLKKNSVRYMVKLLSEARIHSARNSVESTTRFR